MFAQFVPGQGGSVSRDAHYGRHAGGVCHIKKGSELFSLHCYEISAWLQWTDHEVIHLKYIWLKIPITGDSQDSEQAYFEEHAALLQLERSLLFLWTQRRHSHWTGKILSHMTLCFENQFFFSAQEEETGLITGLGDYIHANAPYARDMGPARYDDYYKAPWATSRELEERHRQICADVGASLIGIIYF